MDQHRRKVKILLVEDEAANRILLETILRRSAVPALSSAQLRPVGDLASTRTALAEDKFDFLLLDVQLPDGSGLDLAREINHWPDRPVIVVLSASLWSQPGGVVPEYIDAFLLKPYRSRELVELLRGLLP